MWRSSKRPSLPRFDEVVSEGITGLLVPPRDPAALAGAMAKLVQDADLAAQLGAGGAEADRKASWESIAATTGAVYDQVLA